MPGKPVQSAASLTKPGEDGDLARKLATFESRSRIAVDTTEIATVVEAIVESLSGDLSIADLKLYSELEHLARYIQRAKRDLATIRPHDIRERHIPMATDELDAVADATAAATGEILDQAEVLQKAVAGLPQEPRQLVLAAVTRIFEACNFQDITGQRIAKVVKTLKHIEAKIEALLTAFDDTVTDRRKAVPPKLPDEDFISGPQLPANANTQDQIDAILASFDKKNK
jgi:chemotaxis protein CheZ